MRRRRLIPGAIASGLALALFAGGVLSAQAPSVLQVLSRRTSSTMTNPYQMLHNCPYCGRGWNGVRPSGCSLTVRVDSG